MESILSSVVTSEEKRRLDLFIDLFSEYISDCVSVLESFIDYHSVLTSVFERWFARYNTGESYRFAKTYRQIFDSLYSDVQFFRNDIDDVCLIFEYDGDDSVRFSESDIDAITVFVSRSNDVFSDIFETNSELSTFIDESYNHADCSISFAANKLPYFEKYLSASLNVTAEHLSEVDNMISVLRDDIRRQNRRMGDDVYDEQTIEARKAEIERRVLNMGQKEETLSQPVSDIVTMSFPPEILDLRTQSRKDFYIIPFDNDDFVFIPKKRVKLSRTGSGDYVIACKEKHARDKAFKTHSGNMISFSDLKFIISRLIKENRLD